MSFSTSEDCIRSAEEALGYRLPPAHHDRLLVDNGGDLMIAEGDWTLFPVEDLSDRKRASRTAAHLVKETEQARQWPDFPPAAVAIAGDGSGNYLILLPNEEQPAVLGDMVYIWDHEVGSLTSLGHLEDVVA